MTATCIQCRRSAVILLTRPRPLGRGEYQICLECATRARQEQDERVMAAVAEAERSGV